MNECAATPHVRRGPAVLGGCPSSPQVIRALLRDSKQHPTVSPLEESAEASAFCKARKCQCANLVYD
ncbi:hypothetical protein KFL_000210350 [Klebsormidium nitens]|uniref:Uncharacterized protein n=1 Tax=Klebsormidium nitens TaxID=105231 RepID=A0A1Y1HP13_KLENI|nr:hypothetical protein KFL_000210350 [Klebsormidium nitens]|eukprot:GAQ78949.1 hypothetical protein KFL_000210350 [Klebsormidium nitens]